MIFEKPAGYRVDSITDFMQEDISSLDFLGEEEV